MSDVRVHDVVGVGIGPFNLALAALLTRTPELDAAFLDARPAFAWHPGLMLDEAEVQVPFLADLVTLVDPTSPYSFLSYLHAHDRLYRFYLHERLHPSRREFEAYCRWVAAQLPSCRFGVRVERVEPEGGGWRVETDAADVLHARAVVLGVGGAPVVPPCAQPHLGRAGLLHSADWLTHRERALAAGSVTVIGSGQSAAEVFADLLDHAAPGARLRWYTRSAGFYPMEYSKLGLEHFTPDYTRYFHALPAERRDALLARQDLLYKGISGETSGRIYDALYRRTVDAAELDVAYAANCELRGLTPAAGGWRLELHERLQDAAFADAAELIVLATGHRAAEPPLPRLAELAQLDAHGRPLVDLDHRVLMRDPATPPLYVQNAELHTHGVGTPDLGLGAQRAATIVNALAGREAYRLPARATFQTFGVPADAERLG